jgi:hypothetical protein
VVAGRHALRIRLTASSEVPTTMKLDRNRRDDERRGFEPSRLALGVALGCAVGVALGNALGDIAVGIAVGVGVGAALGASFAVQAGRRKGD